MELVRGGDLFDRIIETGRYPESNARVVMKMLLEGVKYLHDNGIVHRDLKPENILLVERDLGSQVSCFCSSLLACLLAFFFSHHKHNFEQIKISDFGLAKRATHEGLQTFCGTPQYFAPEVLGRRKMPTRQHQHQQNNHMNQELSRGYDFKADMWSLGVVLFIMLSGVFPFDENNLYDQVSSLTFSLDFSLFQCCFLFFV